MPAATERDPIWTAAGGLPPAHLVRAAVHAAVQIDQRGSPVEATHHGYVHYPTGGLYPPADLRQGERFLVEAGLLREEKGMLYPTPELNALVAVDDETRHQVLLDHAIEARPPDWLLAEPVQPPEEAEGALAELVPDPERREAFLLAVARRLNPEALAALGARGEDHMVDVLREELEELGHTDHAEAVRRVSLLSDQLGYDVVAPQADGVNRRIEVKTTTRVDHGQASFFLSRNEAEVGQRDEAWALVVCRVTEADDIEIIGWCRGPTLVPYLPNDAPGGSWRSVELDLPLARLLPDFPPAI